MGKTYHVEYARPNEAFCRVGSDEGFDILESALVFFKYQTKGLEWKGTVRLVDSDGTTVESMSLL